MVDPKQSPDAVVVSEVVVSEVAVTREHREAAFRARYPWCAQVPWHMNAWLNGDDYFHHHDPEGLSLNAIALALATIEHSARPRWIPVSAELPDSDVRVLLANRKGSYLIAELELTDDSEGHGEPYWESGGFSIPLADYPHWMPLPENP